MFSFVQIYGPSKFHFCLSKRPKVVKRLSQEEKKKMQNIPWDIATNRYVYSFFFNLKKHKQKSTSIGVKSEGALIVTNVLRVTFKKSLKYEMKNNEEDMFLKNCHLSKKCKHIYF